MNCGIEGTAANDYSTCYWLDGVTKRWIISIMHSLFYCGGEGVGAENLKWPNVWDRDKVNSIINDFP